MLCFCHIQEPDSTSWSQATASPIEPTRKCAKQTMYSEQPTDSAPSLDTPETVRSRLQRAFGWWTWFAIAATLTGARFMARNDADADLWGHVQYGREVLATGTLPRETTWSFVVEGYRWINHENLAELIMAWTADSFGPLGFTFGKFGLSLLVLGLIVWTNRRNAVNWFSIGLIVIVAAKILQIHWQFRPHLITYTSFAVMLALLEWCFDPFTPIEKRNPKRLHGLWLSLPLFVFWTNGHGGFVAGVCVFCAYMGLRILEQLMHFGTAAFRRISYLAAISVSAVGATLINPYGPKLHAWLIESLGVPRPEISEWAPLDLTSSNACAVWTMLAIAAVSLARSNRRRDWTHLCLLAITLWQGISHIRHIAFFAMACGFWLPPHLHAFTAPMGDDLRRWAEKISFAPWTRWVRPVLLGSWIGLMLGHLTPALGDLRVPQDEFPTRALEFMHENGLHGNVVVTFNWAQYAIGYFAQTQATQPSRVAIDGRFRTCYPQEVLDIYIDFTLGSPEQRPRYRSPDSPGFNPQRALEVGDPDLVLIARNRWKDSDVMQARTEDWTLLYQDSLAQLWGRSSRYDRPESPDYVSPDDRLISDAEQTGSVTWPAFPDDTEPR